MAGDWQETKIIDVVQINTAAYSTNEKWEYVNYLDTSNITNGQIAEIQLISDMNILPSRARRKVKAGDIVYSTVRPNQKHYGIIKEPKDNMLVSTGFAVLRGKNQISYTKFLYYFLIQNHIVEKLQTIAEHSTSAYPSIRPSDIESLKLKLPPFAEQQAIAHILGTLDDKIELNRKMNKTLEEMARAIFKSWFVDFDPLHAKAAVRREHSNWTNAQVSRAALPKLNPEIAELFPDSFEDSELGEIPKGWMVKKIQDITERVSMGPFGSSIKVDTFVPEGIPIISGQHLNGLMLEDNTFNFITHEHAERLKNSNVERGDIVLTHAGNIGQVAYIPDNSRYEKYIISQRQFFMRCDRRQVTPRFMILYFKTGEGQYRLLANTSSSGVPSIAQPVTYLRTIPLITPQKLLIDTFDKLINPLFIRMRQNQNKSNTLSALRNALLPKLISGELRVKHAESFLKERRL
jgi:type I restriction enzyme S subunit